MIKVQVHLCRKIHQNTIEHRNAMTVMEYKEILTFPLLLDMYDLMQQPKVVHYGYMISMPHCWSTPETERRHIFNELMIA